MTSERPSAAIVVDIVCPHCGQIVDARMDLCPRCGRSTSAPPALAPPLQRLIDRPWLIIVMILHVGCLGIPLYWKTRYSLGVRLLLVGLSIIYTVGAVAGILWGCAQILRMMRGI